MATPALRLQHKPQLSSLDLVQASINNYAERIKCEDRLLLTIEQQISICNTRDAIHNLQFSKRNIQLNKLMLTEAHNKFLQVLHALNNEAQNNV